MCLVEVNKRRSQSLILKKQREKDDIWDKMEMNDTDSDFEMMRRRRKVSNTHALRNGPTSGSRGSKKEKT